MPPKPVAANVLYIVADDLRNDASAAYGQRHVRTPNLDALAAGGLTFDRAYCQLARCAPSRHSFLTGRGPQTTRVLSSAKSFRNEATSAWRTLPGHFKASGWLAIGMGKLFPSNEAHDEVSWSTDEVEARFGYPYFGFDMQRCPGVLEARKLPLLVSPTGTWCALEGDRAQFYDHTLTNEAVAALDFIAERRANGTGDGRRHGPGWSTAEQPFLLMVGYVRPHGPWMVPADVWREYSTAAMPLPTATGGAWPTGAPIMAANPSTLWVPPRRDSATAAEQLAANASWELPGGPGNAWKLDTDPRVRVGDREVREVRHGYWAAVTWFDRQVGRLLARLDEHGLTERTIVVMHSDHGYHLGEQGLYRKFNTFELSARVPLIIRVPWKPMSLGKRTGALTELLDMYPTVAALAGAPPPDGAGEVDAPLEGDDVSALFDEPQPRGAAARKRAAFTLSPRCTTETRATVPFTGYCKSIPDYVGFSIRTTRCMHIHAAAYARCLSLPLSLAALCRAARVLPPDTSHTAPPPHPPLPHYLHTTLTLPGTPTGGGTPRGCGGSRRGEASSPPGTRARPSTTGRSSARGRGSSTTRGQTGRAALPTRSSTTLHRRASRGGSPRGGRRPVATRAGGPASSATSRARPQRLTTTTRRSPRHASPTSTRASARTSREIATSRRCSRRSTPG